MRVPITTTLFVLAVVLFIFGSAAMTGYYPAAKPVLGPDGSPLVGADGKLVTHRDMAKYYRVNAPAFILEGCSVVLFGWALVRVSKHSYDRVSKTKTS